jgi:plasmid stabilization system protein ParE
MAALNWTEEAQRWLRDIFDYIATDNPTAAARTVRILHYGHYRIAYLIQADGNIDILGVFHGALDIERFNL